MKDKCDFPAFTAYRLDDDILHIEMKKIKKMTAEDVTQIYECREKIGGGKKAFVIITFNGFIPMSDEAMKEAKRKSKNRTDGASCYVVNNFALRVGIKFFMNFYKPKHAISICKSKAEAIAWLKKEKKRQG